MVEEWEFAELRSKVRRLEGVIKDFRADLQDIRMYLDELESGHENWKEDIETRMAEFEEMKKKIADLDARLERIEEFVRKVSQ